MLVVRGGTSNGVLPGAQSRPVTPRRRTVGPSWRPPNGVVLATIGAAEPILTKEKVPAARLCRLSIAWEHIQMRRYEFSPRLSPPMRHTPRNLPRGALCGCFLTASGEGGPNGPLSVWSLRYGRPLRLRPVSGRATYARGLAVQHLVSQIAVVSRWIASLHSLTTLVRRRTAQLPPADHSGSSRRIGRLFPRVRSSARTVEVAARLIGQCGRLQ